MLLLYLAMLMIHALNQVGETINQVPADLVLRERARYM
jgi:hypothetical protein